MNALILTAVLGYFLALDVQAAQAQNIDLRERLERLKYWTCHGLGACPARDVNFEQVGEIAYKFDASSSITFLSFTVEVKSVADTPKLYSEFIAAVSCPGHALPLNFKFIANDAKPFSKASDPTFRLSAKQIVPLRLVFAPDESEKLPSIEGCDIMIGARNSTDSVSILTHVPNDACRTEDSIDFCDIAPDRVTNDWIRVYRVFEDINLEWEPKDERVDELKLECEGLRDCVAELENYNQSQVIKIYYFCLRGNVFSKNIRNFLFEKSKVNIHLHC